MAAAGFSRKRSARRHHSRHGGGASERQAAGTSAGCGATSRRNAGSHAVGRTSVYGTFGPQSGRGAPVYLETYDLEARRRLNDVRTTRTDLRGQYHFYGLAPGNYRVVSSFEFQAPDSATIDTMRPATVKVDEGQDAAQDLDLYAIQ